MTDTGSVSTGRHCDFALHAHLVFVMAFRHKVFTYWHLTRLLRHNYRANRLWSGSYFAGSLGGAPLTVLYIEQQNGPG